MDIREQIIADITAKVEAKLANHKVELGIIDDFTKEANNTITIGDLMKKESSEIQKKLSVYYKLKNDIEEQRKSLESNLSTIQTRIDDVLAGYNKTSKIYQDLVNKSSDLGIDYPKNVDTSMKNIDDLVKYSKSIAPKNVKL